MSTSPAIPVSFIQNEAITKGVLNSVGLKSSYVKSHNGTVVLMILPAGDVVAVSLAYEKSLRVLAYRFKCWRCPIFEYHLWLDYMYGRHDDDARKLLESQHGITLAAITLRKSGSNILKICLNTLWRARLERNNLLLQLCIWAKLILTGVSSNNGGVVVHRNMCTEEKELSRSEQAWKKKNEDKGRHKDKGKWKFIVLMETETEEEVHREQNIRWSVRGTCSILEIAMENLQSLLLEDVLPISPGIHSDEQRDKILGLWYFKNVLKNYTENLHLLGDFFHLASIAAHAREDIQQAQVPVHAIISSSAKIRKNFRRILFQASLDPNLIDMHVEVVISTISFSWQEVRWQGSSQVMTWLNVQDMLLKLARFYTIKHDWYDQFTHFDKQQP
ncbi:hypothetical protein HD554DRAFT_2034477 [Boletus coccyginus]|nr:hypothetical protein HD554DRAFT_2034477 [Boletus coccyginus]